MVKEDIPGRTVTCNEMQDPHKSEIPTNNVRIFSLAVTAISYWGQKSQRKIHHYKIRQKKNFQILSPHLQKRYLILTESVCLWVCRHIRLVQKLSSCPSLRRFLHQSEFGFSLLTDLSNISLLLLLMMSTKWCREHTMSSILQESHSRNSGCATCAR